MTNKHITATISYHIRISIMETRASFKNISETIQSEILNCKESILIAVAWFTNKELLGLLTDKVKCGLDVKIIISDDIVNKRIDPEEFIKAGGKFTVISSIENKFLHDKFAIFDSKTVISGSYNWTYFAEYKNFESIIISKEVNIIKQFLIRFKQLLEISVTLADYRFDRFSDLGADKAEKQFFDLEKELKEELLFVWKESGKIDKKLQNLFILDFIENYGAIGACKKLMNTGVERIQNGFIKMWEINRMDLTFESVIINVKYKYLFDEKTINIATERLIKFKSSG
ncbi:MAG: hypothetical protein C0397_18645 [Odoribacter sp.]|nr:hypothetical protein [Odoribacter sp.]